MQTFAVHFSTGQPVQPGQPRTNTFGLGGPGVVRFDDEFLTFETSRDAPGSGRTPPRFARADVANVDYVADQGVFLIRTRRSDDFVAFKASSREDAEAIWALLPQEKTPEFLAEQERYARYAKNMQELGRHAPVTPVLIALNVGVFFLMAVSGVHLVQPESQSLIDWGSNFGPLTWTGEPWRLLSAAFLHAGILHIALNLFALYQGGALVERLYGSARFALLYLLSAVSGSVVSGWYDPMRNSVGASGAIFGVYGALLVFFALRREDFPHGLWRSIGLSTLMFCGYSLTLGAAHPAIDNAAHVGGLLGGVIAGLLLVRPLDVQSRRHPRPARLALAAAAVLFPAVLLAWPLMNGSRAEELRFHADYTHFLQPDETYTRRLMEILEPGQGTRGDRLDQARRLRSEVLSPWRASARPLLDAPALSPDSPSAARQSAAREYLEAKDRTWSLIVRALESGDPESARAAEQAGRRMHEALRKLNEIE
jgi:rhomboid protease GluP